MNSVQDNNLTQALTNLQIITESIATKGLARYKIEIADKTGHTTVANLSLDQAVDNILQHAENNARWVFINGEKFEFSGTNFRTAENVQKLQSKLEVQENPDVLLTGVLVGGSKN